MEDLEFLRLVRSALGPRARRMVVVGGGGFRLFLRHPGAAIVDMPLLTTKDLDLATPDEATLVGRGLLDRFEAAGFEERVVGSYASVGGTYGMDGDPNRIIQVIAHRSGSSRRAANTIQVEGVIAECLPHVDLLLISPWEVDLEDGEQGLLIAHPAAFVLQKILIAGDRSRQGFQQVGKDMLYIHDTLQVFGGALSRVAGCEDVLAGLGGGRTRRVLTSVARLCEPDGVPSGKRVENRDRGGSK